MTRSQSLKARLDADSAITSKIGSGDDMRLYPLVALPPNQQTVCIYKFITVPEYTLSGISSVKSALELTSYAQDYDAALDLAAALFTNLQGFKGILGGTQGSPLTSGIDVLELSWTGEEQHLVDISQDQYMFAVVSQYDLTYQL